VWVEEFAGDRDAGESKGWQLVVQWKRGHDVQAFEGFASHVGRKLREATEAEAEVVSRLPGAGGMQIFAKTLNGNTTTLEEKEDTIDNLKGTLCIPPD
jgi:hypothetical protein